MANTIVNLIHNQITGLEDSRRDIREQFEKLPANSKDTTITAEEKPSFLSDSIYLQRLWSCCDLSLTNFRDKLYREDESLAQRVQALTEKLIHLSLPAEIEVKMTETQVHEKIRVAEIAKEEKIRLAELASEEKIRLAEIEKSERIELATLAQQEKLRLRELTKETQTLDINEKIRLEEIRLDETKHLECSRKELEVRLAELEMPLKRYNATKEAAVDGNKYKEKRMQAVLKHIELISTLSHYSKNNSSDGVKHIVSPPDYGDVEQTIQLVEKLTSILEQSDSSLISQESCDIENMLEPVVEHVEVAVVETDEQIIKEEPGQ